MAEPNDFKLIREIVAQGGCRHTSGKVDRRKYQRLVELGWLARFCPSVSDVVYTVTQRGKAAAKRV